jgi:two-component system response regulator AtoC
MNGAVLVVDDDPAVGMVLGAQLRQAGHEVEVTRSAVDALGVMQRRLIDVVISDVRMPGMDGMALLAELARDWPDVPVILLTAHGSVPLAVEAMKAGAHDFVLKPFDRQAMLFCVDKALKTARHTETLPSGGRPSSRLLGRSAAMREVIDLIGRAARSRATVLIRGESGTGKDVAARAIHAGSPRASGPFVKVHCAALPDALLESELFGHERGAFTGAATAKPGRAELADGGTLFLDEIGDITPALQVKLLRLLQERQFERLGAGVTRTVDVRFVAATHQDLEAMVADGRFREDLFYRLNVVPIQIPPLRARRDEIAALARHFCERHARENGRPGLELSPEAVVRLEAEPWPGNVRELENFVERLVVLHDGPRLELEDVARELDRQGALFGSVAPPPRDTGAPEGSTLDARRRDVERDAIEAALRRANNNRTAAARILGVSRRTLYNKLHELALL